MPSLRLPFPLTALLVYPLAFAFGWVLEALAVPLSWLIGAMFASGLMLVRDRPMALMPGSRQFSQIVVGATVGISFTSEALAAAIALLGPMIAITFLGLGASYCAARVMARMTGVSLLTAMLAAISIGPVESVTLARRYGAQVSPVIFSQSFRIAMIVTFLPPVIVWLDPNIQDPSAALRAIPWTAQGAALLLVCAAAGGWVARKLWLPNPYFLGPMIVAITCALTEAPMTGFPYALLTLAQLLMGIWLGASLERAFLLRSHRFLGGMMTAILLLLVLSAASGLGLAYTIDAPWQVGLLATAPGGVAEMALTAKILQQGVAVVISFHLTRIFVLQLIAPFLVRWISRQGETSP